MYSEVRELVNFLCRYLHGRQPRRPVGMFGADLGNFLVSQFSSTWDIHNPKNGESERMVLINCPEGTSPCFHSGTVESGLDYSEIMECFPVNLRIWANPGHVYFRTNDNSIAVPIWIGDVNADELYQPLPEYIVRAAASCAQKYVNASNLGAAGQPFQPSRKPLPTNDRAVLELVNGMYTPLGLEDSDEMANVCHLQEMFPYRFVFKPNSTQTYTGLEFSQTRFGSTKPRPDLQTMCSIKNLLQNQNQSQQSDGASCSTSTPNVDPEHPYQHLY